MKKRVGAGCLLLLVVGAVTLLLAVFRAQSLAREVAARATASIASPDLLDQIPQDWIDILIQVEDPSFFQHPGVDFTTPGQGWTTLTQGLVKRHFSGSLSGPWGKIRQSLFAVAIDRELTKEQQLQIFLETAYFGSLDGEELIGFQNASRALLQKPLLSLSRSQYIGLVAMLVGPNRFHPIARPGDFRDRVSRIEAVIAGRCEPLSWSDVYLDGCREKE